MKMILLLRIALNRSQKSPHIEAVQWVARSLQKQVQVVVLEEQAPSKKKSTSVVAGKVENM